MVVSIVFSFMAVIARAYVLMDLFEFPFQKYMYLIFKLMVTTSFFLILLFKIKTFFSSSFDSFIIIGFISVISIPIIFYFFILEKLDKIQIKNFIINKINKNENRNTDIS